MYGFTELKLHFPEALQPLTELKYNKIECMSLNIQPLQGSFLCFVCCYQCWGQTPVLTYVPVLLPWTPHPPVWRLTAHPVRREATSSELRLLPLPAAPPPPRSGVSCSLRGCRTPAGQRSKISFENVSGGRQNRKSLQSSLADDLPLCINKIHWMKS